RSDVEISVKDDGRGIAASDVERIFDLFTQVDPEALRGQGGLGVGLALVRRIVELHGGIVQARSEGLGKGSEFIVHLPFTVGKPPTPLEARPPEPETYDNRFRVLVVDDNKDAADSLQLLLEAIGQDVITVYDGRAALDAVEKFHPDIVMLDLGMPMMSGYDVAEGIRTLSGIRQPILAAVTGWGQETDRVRTRSAGFEYHLVKPVELDALRRLLENAADALGRRP